MTIGGLMMMAADCWMMMDVDGWMMMMKL